MQETPHLDERSALYSAIARIQPLTVEAKIAMDPLLRRRIADPGTLLLRAGQPSRHVLFLYQGLMREYYVDREGRETTRRFCTEGEFSGSLADMLTGAPAAVSIEAMDRCVVLEAEWKRFDALSELHPSVMKLQRRFAELLYIRKMKREFEMLTLPARERFREFVRENPSLDARLPKHVVASYLGITPVHLSRIRAAEKRRQSQATRTGRK